MIESATAVPQYQRSLRVRSLVLVFVLLLSTATLAPAPTAAQTPITPQQALERLFTSPEVSGDWFEPTFIAQVPLPRVRAIIGAYKDQLGAFQDASPEGREYLVRFARGSVRVTINLSADGRISGLLLGATRFNDKSLAYRNGLTAIRSLPGDVSFLLLLNGETVDSIQPDRRLAVGSAFKLAVLTALKEQIAAGKHSWDEVVHLQPEWKTLPTGVLQNWLDGTALTLETMASQMISISDNTAADGLMDIVGRDTVQRYGPVNNPFLTTRELFLLKSPKLTDLLERYRHTDATGRRSLLSELAAQPSGLLNPDLNTKALDIEWFFSTRELCGLIDGVAELSAFRINPGGIDTSSWRQVAFKGGSEPGVLNLTYHLTAWDGRRYCVAATWNDPAVDVETLLEAMQQIILGIE